MCLRMRERRVVTIASMLRHDPAVFLEHALHRRREWEVLPSDGGCALPEAIDSSAIERLQIPFSRFLSPGSWEV